MKERRFNVLFEDMWINQEPLLRKVKLISAGGPVYINIGCQPNVSKSSQNKAPKVRHQSCDVLDVAPSELIVTRHSISIGLSPYVNINRTFGASAEH